MDHSIEDVRVEVRALLKHQGLRATAPRIAVLVILHEHKAPMTHDEVMGRLPSGAYDKASVWRVLSNLAESNIQTMLPW